MQGDPDFLESLKESFPNSTENFPERDEISEASETTKVVRLRQPIRPDNPVTGKGGGGQSGGIGYPSYYPSSYPYQGYQGYPQSYPQSYPQGYYPYGRPMLPSQMMRNEDQYDPSKLAFSITISLELYPGTNVTKEQIDSIKCNSRWESVRQAWAEFTGKPYVITPKYQQLQVAQNKTQNNRPEYREYNERFGNQYTRRGGRQGKERKGKNKTHHSKRPQMKKLNKTIKL